MKKGGQLEDEVLGAIPIDIGDDAGAGSPIFMPTGLGQFAEVGAGAIIQFRAGLLHAPSRFKGDPRVGTQGTGDGGLVKSNPKGDFVMSDPLRSA